MYVSYLLEKDPGMNGTAGRHPSLNFNHQNFLPAPPQYTDYSTYHHFPTLPGGDPNHGNLSTSGWNPIYPPPREDWSVYDHGTSHLSTNAGSVSLNPRDGTPILPLEQSLVQSVTASPPGQLSPDPQRADSYQWMRRNSALGNTAGKTRTKDKYRVVYNDHQRVELEKEFHYSRYITIRRKAELALTLGLSERQVKIWFQNRRAKERKMTKRKMQQPQQAPSPDLDHHGNNFSTATSSSGTSGFLTDTISMRIKEEF